MMTRILKFRLFFVFALTAFLPCNVRLLAQTQTDQLQNSEKVVAHDSALQIDQAPSDTTNSARLTSPGGGPRTEVIPTTERNFLRNVLLDQKNIWTSPKQLRFRDLDWVVPFAGITAGLIVTDRTTSHELSRGNHTGISSDISNGGLALGVSTGAGLYLLGKTQHDPHEVETGILSAESALNTLGVVEITKFATGRDRPFEGNGSGRFFRGGPSFPSQHSAVAWSIASVIAHEYPGWLTQTLAYGGATAVSMARVTGKQHFLSDVVVGGIIGYFVGKHVYNAHHDQDLGGAEWGNFSHSDDQGSSSKAIGSIYVPLDNWVYPALDRLAGMGVIHTQFTGLRPWTRLAIFQMLTEVDESVFDLDPGLAEAQGLYDKLKAEFAAEDDLSSGTPNDSIGLDSVYTRTMFIAGRPVNDSYHFGQTIINDFGRPYQQGFNNITGFTSHAESGRFSFFTRGEYQHAPSAAPYPLSVRQVIANADINPLQPANPVVEENQFRLLDTYVSMAVLGNEISVGKQSFWWGPSASGPMLMSDNAEPFYMVRINRVFPLEIPLLSKILGPIRYDAFFGRLAGHRFPPRPFLDGQKISFKPTQNLEIGFSKTSVFAGQGLTPLNLRTFWNSLVSLSESSKFNIRQSPGARHSAFDFSYRLPYLRNWLTLYSDSVVHDDVSPISAPRRSGINPGIYLSHFPKLSKLDFRAEAVSTATPSSSNGGKFIYWETVYHDAHTNKGNLLGSWIGREGKGYQVWSTYWLSPESTVQLAFRNAKISKAFIPLGATQNDFSLNSRLRVRKDFELRGDFQFERWSVPVLAPNRTSDFTASVQLTFWPEGMKLGRK